MNGKSDDPKAGTKIVSERQLRAAAKSALRKADRFWRLAQKASSESYKEHRAKQARDASEIAADKTRQASELRAKAHEQRDRAET
jgi:hypothetical protein